MMQKIKKIKKKIKILKIQKIKVIKRDNIKYKIAKTILLTNLKKANKKKFLKIIIKLNKYQVQKVKLKIRNNKRSHKN